MTVMEERRWNVIRLMFKCIDIISMIAALLAMVVALWYLIEFGSNAIFKAYVMFIVGGLAVLLSMASDRMAQKTLMQPKRCNRCYSKEISVGKSYDFPRDARIERIERNEPPDGKLQYYKCTSCSFRWAEIDRRENSNE